MLSSGMLRRAALVRTDVLEEHIASIIREGDRNRRGRKLAVTSNRNTLPVLVTFPDDVGDTFLLIVVLTRATRHNIAADGILQ
jgi:hypothetical protein